VVTDHTGFEFLHLRRANVMPWRFDDEKLTDFTRKKACLRRENRERNKEDAGEPIPSKLPVH
jgi:hypothetical protein